MFLSAFISLFRCICADALKRNKISVSCVRFASIDIRKPKLLQPITSHQLSTWLLRHVLHAAASRTASWKITIRRTQLQHSFYFISDEQMALRVLLWTAKRCVFHRADITAGSYNKWSLLTYGHMTASHESFSRIRQLTPTCTTHLIYGLLGQQVRHLPRNDIFIGSGALAVRPHQFLQHRLQNMWCM